MSNKEVTGKKIWTPLNKQVHKYQLGEDSMLKNARLNKLIYTYSLWIVKLNHWRKLHGVW